MYSGKQLDNIHLLIVDGNEVDKQVMLSALEAEGAICHVVQNRTEALGLYLTLFTDSIVPRAIITGWYINPPSTREYKFYKAINRPEANTSKALIERFRKLDKEVEVIIYTSYVDDIDVEDVPVVLKGSKIQVLIDAIKNSNTIIKYLSMSNDVVRGDD